MYHQYLHISSRRGKQKAYFAIAHGLVVIMYHEPMRNEPYPYGREKTTNGKVKKLHRLIGKVRPN